MFDRCGFVFECGFEDLECFVSDLGLVDVEPQFLKERRAFVDADQVGVAAKDLVLDSWVLVDRFSVWFMVVHEEFVFELIAEEAA